MTVSLEMTDVELAILGLIAEGPKYGYQIEGDIEQRGMREWTEIGFSSIYYVLNKLEKQNWLSSEMSVEGNRPARKIYSATPAGIQALRNAVKSCLSQPRLRSGDFDLALANLAVLSKDEIVTGLQSYRAMLVKRLAQVKAKWETDRQLGLPPHIDRLFEHSVMRVSCELDWVSQYLNAIEGE
jgi:DNA-binding PadR family transcriptional regulator